MRFPLTLMAPAGEAEAAAARSSELEAELAAQKELAARLEEDLLAAEHAGAPSTGSGGAAGELGDAGDGGGGGGEQTMVSVLCSQRDRYRARVQEVEGHLATLGQELKKVGRRCRLGCSAFGCTAGTCCCCSHAPHIPFCPQAY
jgi:membrane protein involved in colicin uptake